MRVSPCDVLGKDKKRERCVSSMYEDVKRQPKKDVSQRCFTCQSGAAGDRVRDGSDLQQ